MTRRKTPRPAPPLELVACTLGPPDKIWTREEFDAALSSQRERLMDLCRDVQANFGPMGVMQMLVQAAGYVSRTEGVPVDALAAEIRMTLQDQFDLDLPAPEAADADA
jgi:hypothetical protein